MVVANFVEYADKLFICLTVDLFQLDSDIGRFLQCFAAEEERSGVVLLHQSPVFVPYNRGKLLQISDEKALYTAKWSVFLLSVLSEPVVDSI